MMKQKANCSEIDRVRVGLATVAMAVTASSAFPGFFTPLELTGRDVGARGGEFGRQAYTDGGVFDNLGVRMFRWLTPLLEGENALDGVLVSDVGKRIEVQAAQRGGLIRAAMRSSDILMDRVWQLESENFQDSFGFVFARITDVVARTRMRPPCTRSATSGGQHSTDLDAFCPSKLAPSFATVIALAVRRVGRERTCSERTCRTTRHGIPSPASIPQTRSMRATR